MSETVGSFIGRLEDKTAPQLAEIKVALLEENVLDELERIRLTEALARLDERTAVRNAQLRTIDDQLRTRGL